MNSTGEGKNPARRPLHSAANSPPPLGNLEGRGDGGLQGRLAPVAGDILERAAEWISLPSQSTNFLSSPSAIQDWSLITILRLR